MTSETKGVTIYATHPCTAGERNVVCLVGDDHKMGHRLLASYLFETNEWVQKHEVHRSVAGPLYLALKEGVKQLTPNGKIAEQAVEIKEGSNHLFFASNCVYLNEGKLYSQNLKDGKLLAVDLDFEPTKIEVFGLSQLLILGEKRRAVFDAEKGVVILSIKIEEKALKIESKEEEISWSFPLDQKEEFRKFSLNGDYLLLLTEKFYKDCSLNNIRVYNWKTQKELYHDPQSGYFATVFVLPNGQVLFERADVKLCKMVTSDYSKSFLYKGALSPSDSLELQLSADRFLTFSRKSMKQINVCGREEKSEDWYAFSNTIKSATLFQDRLLVLTEDGLFSIFDLENKKPLAVFEDFKSDTILSNGRLSTVSGGYAALLVGKEIRLMDIMKGDVHSVLPASSENVELFFDGPTLYEKSQKDSQITIRVVPWTA